MTVEERLGTQVMQKLHICDLSGSQTPAGTSQGQLSQSPEGQGPLVMGGSDLGAQGLAEKDGEGQGNNDGNISAVMKATMTIIWSIGLLFFK